jgi:hypothetical protein
MIPMTHVRFSNDVSARVDTAQKNEILQHHEKQKFESLTSRELLDKKDADWKKTGSKADLSTRYGGSTNMLKNSLHRNQSRLIESGSRTRISKDFTTSP